MKSVVIQGRRNVYSGTTLNREWKHYLGPLHADVLLSNMKRKREKKNEEGYGFDREESLLRVMNLPADVVQQTPQSQKPNKESSLLSSFALRFFAAVSLFAAGDLRLRDTGTVFFVLIKSSTMLDRLSPSIFLFKRSDNGT